MSPCSSKPKLGETFDKRQRPITAKNNVEKMVKVAYGSFENLRQEPHETSYRESYDIDKKNM